MLNKTTSWNVETKSLMQIVSIIMTLISAYFVMVIVIFQCKQKFKTRTWSPTEAPRSFSRRIFTVQLVRKFSSTSNFFQTNNNNNDKLKRFHCLSAVSVTARCLHEAVYAFMEPYFKGYCTFYLRVHIILYALAIASIYIFLWMRQRFLYKNPKMVGYNLQYSRVMSWLVIVIMVAAEILTIVIFMVTRQYKIENGYCELIKKNPLLDTAPWAVLATLTVIFQILLMWLFIYPLLRHRKMMKKSNQSFKKTDQNLIPLVKRTTAMAGICVASDILAVIVTNFINIRSSNYIYDINLLINLCCITYSFTNWKKILFPFI